MVLNVMEEVSVLVTARSARYARYGIKSDIQEEELQSFSSFSDENINYTLQVIDIPGAYSRQDLWNSYREANY